MSEEDERKEAFLQRKAKCITHMEHHRIYFQPGDRYEKVLFHHCDLHCPEGLGPGITFLSCVFWGCRYFKGETEVPNLYEAMGGEKYIKVSDEDKRRIINAEGFTVLCRPGASDREDYEASCGLGFKTSARDVDRSGK